MRASHRFMRHIALSLGLALALSGAGAAAEPQQNVLVLHSYHSGHGKTAQTRPVLHAALGEAFRVHEEYLDTKFQLPGESFAQMEEMLAWKIGRTGPPDVVITIDDNALEFAVTRQQSLLGGAPIVFAGVNSRDLTRRALDTERATGVFENYSIEQTLALAKRMNGAPLRQVVAVVDHSPTSQALNEVLRTLEHRFPSIAFRRLDLGAGSFDDAAETLKRHRRPDTALLYLVGMRDASGAVMRAPEMLAFLNTHAARPVYALDDHKVRKGAAGGAVLVAADHVRTIAAMAKRILAGEPVGAVAPVLDSAPTLMIDERRAMRFGLRLDRLPENALVLNPVPTLWERNLGLLASAAVALAAILALMLVVQLGNARARRRLKDMNTALKIRNVELTEAKKRIEHQALHDALTGLPNRRFLERRLAELAGGGLKSETCALLHIDLDHFKQINDALGHLAGDHVLRTVAARLHGAAPTDGFVARIGGDEFLVLGGFENRGQAGALAATLQERLRQPFLFEGRELRVSASIGICCASPRKLNAAKLFQRADIALYRAKSEGRDGVAFFSSSMEAEAVSNKALADDIARGLAAGEFEPFFQPQICARTGEVAGLEALARWRHPTRGLLAPNAFLPVAQGIGAVAEIDDQILLGCAERLKAWRGRGLAPRRLSVNISGRRLHDPRLIERVETLDLGETRLAVELLESIFLDDADEAPIWAVDRLREVGVAIEIDDFGTGHASIVSLLSLRPDRLKIARELTATIDSCPMRLGLLRSIVQIGRSLDVGVTAEGVERASQERLLVEMGCTVLQGYYYSKPLPAEEAAAFLADRGAPSRLAEPQLELSI